MAIKGTPFQGRDNLIIPRVYTGLTLVLYVNLPDSLGESSVAADLVQPTGAGYAPIVLNGVWSAASGVATYDHGTPDDPFWQSTEPSANWSQPITGAAIIAGAGPYLLHFQDNPDGQVVMTPGQKFVVDLSNLVAP